jgi:hypothetical protein
MRARQKKVEIPIANRDIGNALSLKRPGEVKDLAREDVQYNRLLKKERNLEQP